MTKQGVALDLDEFIEAHPDVGCVVCPSCLACPLAQCIYDAKNSWQAIRRWQNQERDKRIRQRVAAGESVIMVADDEELNPRSVYRVMAGRAVL